MKSKNSRRIFAIVLVLLLGLAICLESFDSSYAAELEASQEKVFMLAPESETLQMKVLKLASESDAVIDEGVSFEGDSADYEEFIHLLLAKIVYDSLNEYEGKSVADYVNGNPDLYDKEIWKDSQILYKQVYDTFIGDYKIAKIIDENDNSGMYAVVFTRDKEIVLTFRGSDTIYDSPLLDESNDWVNTDFRFALQNQLSSQFKDVDRCLRYIENQYQVSKGEYDYTFAGHSLGGALVAYSSIMTGYYGYSFDGAVGHVIDIIYSDRYLEVASFEGSDKQNFCNYTDKVGYPIADIIQHTNSEAIYQLDRETNLKHLNENTLVPKLAQAGSHIIWSTVQYDGRVISLTDKVKAKNSGYTYAPKKKISIDIAKPASSFFDVVWTFVKSGFKLDVVKMISTLTSSVKDKKVILASSSGGRIDSFDIGSFLGGYTSGTVLYGGKGDDKLIGYKYDDVLIAGTGNDTLDGGKGDDKYVIDANPNGTTIIKDESGTTRIMFRNMNIRSLAGLSCKNDKLELDNNQIIEFDIASDETVKLYAYNDGNIIFLGNIEALKYKDKIE